MKGQVQDAVWRREGRVSRGALVDFDGAVYLQYEPPRGDESDGAGDEREEEARDEHVREVEQC